MYSHHALYVGYVGQRIGPRGLLGGDTFAESNAQLASFGMGKLFVHIHTGPNWKVLRDFEIAGRASGMTQIWPPPAIIWPFSKRATKFPPKLTLTDDAAHIMAEAFGNRARWLGRDRPRLTE
jgi:hypothetical protein